MKFFQTKGYKVISGFIYGWGASCVIVGALFKIMHFPGAGIVLTVGMLVEAFIFFFSAFEPQMEHYDWSRVFPQLGKGTIHRTGQEEALSGLVDLQPSPSREVLNGLEQQDIEALRKGIRKIADTADSFACIAGNAPVVAQKMDRIAGTFELLDNHTRQVSQALENSARTLTDGYNEFNRLMTASTRDLSEKVRENLSRMTEDMQRSGEQFAALGHTVEEQNQRIRTEAGLCAQQIELAGKSIAALNALYEVELQETRESLEVFRKVKSATSEVLNHMAESRENVGRFKQETRELAGRVTSLNDVYGNMLSLVNNN